MKSYIGLSRDHSASMRGIARYAGQDYNTKIDAIKEASIENKQNTIVSVVECGSGHTSLVKRVVVNSDVNALEHITDYRADGHGTPLFDSVGDLIEQFQSVPDRNDENVSFLVMAITDGYENRSVRYNADTISRKIRELTATDRWTFVFRVPRGHASRLSRLGIPEGNILEWDQTQAGVETAAKHDSAAFTQYFKTRSTGATSVDKFYSNLSEVSSKDVEANLTDISQEVTIWPVSKAEDGFAIRDFVEGRLKGDKMLKGAGFYQLTKTEKKVQEYKKILIRDRNTEAVYYGQSAKQLMGVPARGDFRLAPGDHSHYDIFIQSTSVNRKLKTGTSLVYWPDVGIAYKEGPSSI